MSTPSFARYLPYTLGLAAITSIISTTEKLVNTGSVISNISNTTTAFLCSTPTQPSWFDSDVAIQAIQPVLTDKTIAVALLGLSILVFLLNRRADLPKAGVFSKIRSTLISAAAVTIIIHVIIISIRIRSQNHPVFQQHCKEVALDRLRILTDTAPKTVDSYLPLIPFPDPKNISKEFSPLVHNLYSQVYPIARFGFKNIKTYISYGSLGLGVILIFPFLRRVFTTIQPFAALSGAIYLLTLYYSKALANINSFEAVTNLAQNLQLSRDNLTEFVIAFATFFSLIFALTLLLGTFANVFSRRFVILGTVLLWYRAHALGLPWLGSISFEIFAVVLVLVILFNVLENTAGLFLLSGSLAKFYPSNVPTLFVEWYLVLATGYSVLTKILSVTTPIEKEKEKGQGKAKAKQAHQEDAKVVDHEHKPKQKSAEQRRKSNNK